MATKTSVVKVTIVGEGDSAKKALGDVAGAGEDLEKRTTGPFGRVAEVMGGVLGAQMVGKVVDFGREMIGLGNQLQTMGRKAETVFGDQIGVMRDWADEVNGSLGLSEEATLDMATSLSDLLKPMGFTAEQAAGMSQEMVGLSGALSAWSNGTKSSAEVSDILTKAMLGERDGLKALGISISEADVAGRLAAKGQSQLTGAALEQAKAVATQELIMEKSTDAQKAWADGTMDAVKGQNEAKAEVEDLKAAIALRLVPIFNTVVSILVGKIIPAFMAAGEWIGEHKELVIAAAIGVGTVLVPALVAWAASAAAAAAATIAAAAPVIAIGAAVAALAAGVIWAYQNVDWFRASVDAVAAFITGTVVPAFQSFIGWIGDFAGALMSAYGWVKDNWPLLAAILTGPFGIAALAIVKHWDDIKGAATGAKEWIVTKVTEIKDTVTGLPGQLAGNFTGMFDGIKDAWRSAWNWIIDKWNGLEFKMPEVDTHIPGVGKVGGWALGTPDLPRLAFGGTAVAPGWSIVGDAGPELLNMPRGASVVPLDRASTMGATYTHNVTIVAPVGSSPAEIGRTLVEYVDAYERRNGRVYASARR
jgi:hypothetical protein